MRKLSVLGDTLLYVVSSGVSRGLLLLLVPLLTQFLSVEEFGLYDFLLTLISFLSIIFAFGLPQALQMEFLDMTNNRDLITTLFSTHFFIGLVLIPVILVISVIFNFLPGSHSLLTLILLFAFIYAQAYLSFYNVSVQNILKINQESIFYLKYSLVIATFQFLLSIAIIYFVENNKVLYLLGLGTLSALMSVVVCSKKLQLAINFNKVDVRVLFKRCNQGIVLVASYFAYWLMNGADRLIVLRLLGEHQQGIYSIAARVSSMVEPLVITPILTSLLSVSFRKYSVNDYNDKYKTICFMVFLLFVGGAILSYYTLPWILSAQTPLLVYEIVPYFLLGYAFFFIAQLASNPLVYHKLFSRLLINIVLVGVINVVLNILFLKKFGLKGSACAFLIGNMVWALLAILQRYYALKRISSDTVTSS